MLWQKSGMSVIRRSGNVEAPARLAVDLASAALLALQDFDDAPDEIISRLQALLQRLHERDQSRGACRR